MLQYLHMDKKENKKKISLPEKYLPIQPLTRAEMHEAARERLSKITKEFKEGFEFLEDYSASVTFFGSARVSPENKYYQIAKTLGEKIVRELNYAVITGGGPGIMEAANRGAFEAQGSSVGITIDLPHEQATNPYVTNSMPLYYFFVRKVALTFSAEAFVYFPGGFGTLDELFEILTLVQTNKIERVPIILFGSEYWQPMVAWLKEALASEGMIDSEDLSLFSITDDIDEAMEIIKNSPVRNGVRYKHLND